MAFYLLIWVAVLAALGAGSRLAAWLLAVFQVATLLLLWGQWLMVRRNLERIPLFGKGEDQDSAFPCVTIVVPARDEARSIEAAVRSMLTIRYPNFEVVAVNDHSSDETPRILERLAAEYPHLRVLHDPPRPEGWGGKQNAVWQGVQRACAESEWLLLTDADIMFGPAVVRDAVAYAEREKADFVTCIPQLETDSLAQQLIMVAGWYRLLQVRRYPDPKKKIDCGAGVGAFMLVRRSLYLEYGGHSAIASAPVEDATLATLFRSNGAEMRFAWAGQELTCHQYHGWSETWTNLVQKQRRLAAGSAKVYFVTMNHNIIVSVLPLFLALACLGYQLHNGFDMAFSAAGVTSFLGYLQGVMIYRAAAPISTQRCMAPWLHPLGGLLRIWVCLAAIWHDILNRPIHWRGRTVPVQQ